MIYIDLCRFHAGGLPRRLESQGASETLGGAWRCPFGCPFCRTAPGAFVPSRPSTCLAASQWPVLSCRAPNAPSMLRTTENLIVFHDALHMLYCFTCERFPQVEMFAVSFVNKAMLK